MELQNIADCEGVFANGYTSEMINETARDLAAATGTEMICVWAYIDDFGYGGDSQIYTVRDGVVHEIGGTLQDWLHYNADGGDLRVQLSPPDTWVGVVATEPQGWSELSGDGHSNYALETRN
ncbi:hypothetical protein MUG78_17575 [Gordonia alkaliphila]|uniref:hypothetical protein n=1 Tax=Gordonia alkaliphila TaxID=1053547 RepID=UPI001FF6EE75|nr:hypothetical protein [Gordonia alkaliphila]MCK0441212.1 hypothetical protein [Gordonia alkaliphila]